MSSIKFRLRGSFLAVLAVGLVWIGCTDNSADLTSPADLGPNILVVDQVALSHAIRVQEAHTDEMFEIDGVVGTGVGLAEDGQLVVKVFTREAGVAGLPERLEDVPVAVEVTGMIFALRAEANPAAWFPRPVPIGVSTGHPSITAGTVGARVKKGTDVFALSNNHVYADQNDASIGDGAIQPGAFDGGTDPADRIGTLADFEPIKFAIRRSRPTNLMDAAIVKSSTDLLGNATPEGGYGTPSSTTASAFVNQKVQKYGRTTGLTHGAVDAVNVTVDVCYEGFGRCTKLARFTKQIVITPGAFSGGGDSGSLIVTDDDNNNPVGLLFAGSSSHTIANRIDLVLVEFGVTIDGPAAAATNNPPSADAGGPYSGLEDAAITFDGSSSSDPDNDPLTYTWDFGDDNTATTTSATITHSYAVANTYVVTLVVNDGVVDSDQASTNAVVSKPTVGTAPVVGACNPSTGNRTEWIPVTVGGLNFQDGATVSFGRQIKIRDVSFVSSIELTVVIEVHKKAQSGARDVTVTNPDGQTGTKAACFNVN